MKTKQAIGRYIHLPKGPVTIRILTPAYEEHHIFRTKEEVERYQAITHDCPLCKAGVPLKGKP